MRETSVHDLFRITARREARPPDAMFDVIGRARLLPSRITNMPIREPPRGFLN